MHCSLPCHAAQVCPHRESQAQAKQLSHTQARQLSHAQARQRSQGRARQLSQAQARQLSHAQARQRSQARQSSQAQARQASQAQARQLSHSQARQRSHTQARQRRQGSGATCRQRMRRSTSSLASKPSGFTRRSYRLFQAQQSPWEKLSGNDGEVYALLRPEQLTYSEAQMLENAGSMDAHESPERSFHTAIVDCLEGKSERHADSTSFSSSDNGANTHAPASPCFHEDTRTTVCDQRPVALHTSFTALLLPKAKAVAHSCIGTFAAP